MYSKAIPLCLVILILSLLAACSGEVNGVPEPRESSGASIADGRRLIATYGCGLCHTIPGIPGADSMAGPPLNCFYERTYIAGHLANTWDNLMKWIEDPQSIDPNTAMPNLGVKQNEAHDIAAYLYHRPSFLELRGFDRDCS